MESWQGIADALSVPMSAYLAVTSLSQQISSIYDLKKERCRSRNLLPAWGGRKTPLEFIICHLPPWRQLRAELSTCGWDLKWADARRERHSLSLRLSSKWQQQQKWQWDAPCSSLCGSAWCWAFWKVRTTIFCFVIYQGSYCAAVKGFSSTFSSCWEASCDTQFGMSRFWLINDERCHCKPMAFLAGRTMENHWCLWLT